MALTKPQSEMLTGSIVQVASYQTQAHALFSTILPGDATIPTSTEGTEILSCSITPKSATNKLKITVVLQANANAIQVCGYTLFQDAGTSSIATGYATPGVANMGTGVVMIYHMTAGTTSSTTFKVRAGPAGNTMYINGYGGTSVYGGTLCSSITIEEIAV